MLSPSLFRTTLVYRLTQHCHPPLLHLLQQNNVKLKTVNMSSVVNITGNLQFEVLQTSYSNTLHCQLFLLSSPCKALSPPLLHYLSQVNPKLTTINMPSVVNVGGNVTFKVMRVCMFTNIYTRILSLLYAGYGG
jgi:hypothetical protein